MSEPLKHRQTREIVVKRLEISPDWAEWMERENADLRKQLEEAKKKEAQLEVTACYFPGKGEVDLTWEDLDRGNRASLTTKVDSATGKQIAQTVMACVVHQARVKGGSQ